MPNIKTETTVKKWATFKESDVKRLVAESLGVSVDDIYGVSWPINPLISSHVQGATPREKELTVYLK